MGSEPKDGMGWFFIRVAWILPVLIILGFVFELAAPVPHAATSSLHGGLAAVVGGAADSVVLGSPLLNRHSCQRPFRRSLGMRLLAILETGTRRGLEIRHLHKTRAKPAIKMMGNVKGPQKSAKSGLQHRSVTWGCTP